MNSLVFILLSTLLGSVDEAEVERLIARNEETLRGIHTLRATIGLKQTQDGGKTWRTIRVTSVTRSGRREIIHDHLFGAIFGDTWREAENRSCNLYGPTESRGVGGYGGERPLESPLTDEEVDKIKGSFLVLPDYGAAGWVNAWKRQAMLQPTEVTLRDLFKTYKARSVEKRTDPSGRTTWVVEAVPNTPGAIHLNTLTFSPDHGYLITEIETSADFQGQIRLHQPLRPRLP